MSPVVNVGGIGLSSAKAVAYLPWIIKDKQDMSWEQIVVARQLFVTLLSPVGAATGTCGHVEPLADAGEGPALFVPQANDAAVALVFGLSLVQLAVRLGPEPE